MTMEIVLAWMDSGDDPGVKKVKIITQESNFIKNMKTVYRESEDRISCDQCCRENIDVARLIN